MLEAAILTRPPISGPSGKMSLKRGNRAPTTSLQFCPPARGKPQIDCKQEPSVHHPMGNSELTAYGHPTRHLFQCLRAFTLEAAILTRPPISGPSGKTSLQCGNRVPTMSLQFCPPARGKPQMGGPGGPAEPQILEAIFPAEPEKF